MIAHPFEIKPSVSSQTPDELMITWGSMPTGSTAQIYLPAVAASNIIALADKLYVKHRLTATDANTIQCPAGDVTFVPIPQGPGRYAGLLALDLPSGTRPGAMYTVAVRQLTHVSATTEPPPPPPPVPQIEALAHVRPASVASHTFSWRQVVGAFQYTLTVTSPGELLFPQERLLAWLKWRVEVTPPNNRWLPVLNRYLNLTEGLVLTLGGSPGKIPPSQIGNVPGKCPEPRPPVPRPPHAEECEFTGKVVALHYDRFGDFSGFVILTEVGHEHRFRAREPAMKELLHQAWVERTVVSVVVEGHDHQWPASVILRRYR